MLKRSSVQILHGQMNLDMCILCGLKLSDGHFVKSWYHAPLWAELHQLIDKYPDLKTQLAKGLL